MQYRDVELRGIPVITRSGQKVGKLSAYVIDAEHHEVAQYVVTRSSLLARILPDELLVHRSQVVSLDAEMMVIEDAVVTEKAAERAMPHPTEAAQAGGASASTAASTLKS